MKRLLVVDGRCAFRYQHVVTLGVTLLMLSHTQKPEADAAWIAYPFSQTSEKLAAGDSNHGYVGVIRKLLADARELEEEGKLDRAIIVAERAHRLSLSSSSIARQAPDLSPDLLAKYAKDLKTKRADRDKGKNSNIAARTSPPSKERRIPTGNSTIADTIPRPVVTNTAPANAFADTAPRAVFKEEEPQADLFQVFAPAPQPAANSVAKNAETRLTPAVAKTPPPPSVAKAQDAVVINPRTSLDKEPVIAKPQLVPQHPLDERSDWFDDATEVARKDDDHGLQITNERQDSVASPVTKKDVAVSQAEMSDDWDVDDGAKETIELVVEESAPPAEAQSPKKVQETPVVESKPSRLKLRPRFVADEPRLDLDADTETAVVEEEPRSIVDLPSPRDWSDEPAEPVKAPKAKDRGAERIALKSPAFREYEVPPSPKGTKESRPETANDVADTAAFPTERVVQLRKKMASAIALRPGEIPDGKPTSLPTTIVQAEPTKEAEETAPEIRSVRLRKHPPKPSEPKAEVAAKPQSKEGNQPVVVQSSIIQWKSAQKNGKNVAAEKMETFELRDLRRTIGEDSMASRDEDQIRNSVSPSTLTLSPPPLTPPSAADVSREEIAKRSLAAQSSKPSAIHGNLWDHATAPAATGSSGTICGSTQLMNLKTVELGFAPQPPAEANYEQASFDPPAELFNRRQTVNGQPPALESESHRSALADDATSPPRFRPAKESDDRQNQAVNSLVKDAHASAATKTVENSKSNASSLFVIAGLALFCTGLWVARETIRAKNSES